MKINQGILILFITFSHSLLSQKFSSTLLTFRIGSGIVSERSLDDSWIKVTPNEVTTHIINKNGEIKELNWPVVTFVENSISKNKLIDLGESMTVLNQNNEDVQLTFYQKNGLLYIKFLQTYSGVSIEYNVKETK